MTCSPYHQKPPQIDPRAVRRIHTWKFGHDPSDPDTHEDSGWVYATIEPSTPSEPNQRYLLSGGLDSSALVAMMSRAGVAPIHTFSLGYKDETFSELPYARIVAKHFGTTHRELIIDPVTPQVIEKA